jgi:hypothetical protein
VNATEQEVEQENESSTGGDGSFLTGGTGAQLNLAALFNDTDQDADADASNEVDMPVNVVFPDAFKQAA